VRDVRAALLALPEVQGLHELHVWGMSTSATAFTVHLVVAAPQVDRDALLKLATQTLAEKFSSPLIAWSPMVFIDSGTVPGFNLTP